MSRRPPTLRAMTGDLLVVDRPGLQPRRSRMIYSTLTMIAWAVWIYLWLPLITVVAWYFGLRAFLREVVIPDPRTMLFIGGVYGAVILLLGVLLLGWSFYNLRRFRGKTRRSEPPPVRDEEIGAWFGVDPEILEGFRESGSLRVDLDDEGAIREVRLEALAVPTA